VAHNGSIHIDIAEVQTAEGKLYLFVAIDRTSKFAYLELHPKAGKMAGRNRSVSPSPSRATVQTAVTVERVKWCSAFIVDGRRIRRSRINRRSRNSVCVAAQESPDFPAVARQARASDGSPCVLA